MKKYLLFSVVWLMFWLSASSQSIVRIPINQNPVFQVSTNSVEVAFPEEVGEMVLGADIVIKGGSGVYKYVWKNTAGNELGNEPLLSIRNPGTYLLTVTDTCDCEQIVVFRATTSSVEELNIANFTISPNPTDGYIKIEGFDPCQIVAVDMSGRMVALINNEFSKTINEADLSYLSPGVYLLTLTDANNKSVAYRLIKK